MKKYPLLLSPVTKDYLWGGNRLKTEYGISCPTEICAESWMLACHSDGTNTVLNGDLAGKSLSQVLSLWGNAETFPLLIKFIDAKDKLSVQVHPEDEYAYKNEGEPGKTEMWYIVDCDEGAELIYGFKRSLDKAEFEQRIRDNTLDKVLNYLPVHKGDLFFITAGTLHAIGKGILIAEIQQNSNTTYRVSDYGRLGADGKPRALHIEKALDVTKTEPPTIPYGQVGEVSRHSFGKIRKLAECEYFKVNLTILDGKFQINQSSFVSLLILDGEITVQYEGGIIQAKKGDSIYIPENCTAMISGKGEIICSQK